MFTACLDLGWISYFSGFAWFSPLAAGGSQCSFSGHHLAISPTTTAGDPRLFFFNADGVYVTPVTQDHYYSINATQDYEILRTTSTVPMELGTIEYQTIPCSTLQYRAI